MEGVAAWSWRAWLPKLWNSVSPLFSRMAGGNHDETHLSSSSYLNLALFPPTPSFFIRSTLWKIRTIDTVETSSAALSSTSLWSATPGGRDQKNKHRHRVPARRGLTQDTKDCSGGADPRGEEGACKGCEPTLTSSIRPLAKQG